MTPKRFLQEFRVTEDAILPVGTHLYASHFVPGQYVDVTSKTLVYRIQELSIFLFYYILELAKDFKE